MYEWNRKIVINLLMEDQTIKAIVHTTTCIVLMTYGINILAILKSCMSLNAHKVGVYSSFQCWEVTESKI